jgi:hypothetical protein
MSAFPDTHFPVFVFLDRSQVIVRPASRAKK